METEECNRFQEKQYIVNKEKETYVYAFILLSFLFPPHTIRIEHKM
jgi:hypothetical protein